MFYVKAKTGEEIELTDENIYTHCPECGREHRVDLQEILGDGEGDLCGTSVYCRECSKSMSDGEVKALPLRRPVLDLSKWEPSPEDEEAIYHELHEEVVGAVEACGTGSEEAVEALGLYDEVMRGGVKACKDALQEHYADLYFAVGGDLSYYDHSPEIVELIKKTCCPTDCEESAC